MVWNKAFIHGNYILGYDNPTPLATPLKGCDRQTDRRHLPVVKQDFVAPNLILDDISIDLRETCVNQRYPRSQMNLAYIYWSLYPKFPSSLED